jgi:putative SOS response-associated peptidase YedK
MCGRFDRHSELEVFAELIEGLVLDDKNSCEPSYNITPSQKAVTVALSATGERKMAPLEWGLVPGWVSKTGLQRPINARSETMFSKPMFKHAANKRRCLILCDGFYEWGKTDTGKQPYYFRRDDGKPFVMGGLWESNRRLTDQSIYSFCAVTKQASQGLSAVHHRMPLILDSDGINQWLNPEKNETEIDALVGTVDGAGIGYHAVSSLVNSPANNSPECFEPL